MRVGARVILKNPTQRATVLDFRDGVVLAEIDVNDRMPSDSDGLIEFDVSYTDIYCVIDEEFSDY